MCSSRVRGRASLRRRIGGWACQPRCARGLWGSALNTIPTGRGRRSIRPRHKFVPRLVRRKQSASSPHPASSATGISSFLRLNFRLYTTAHASRGAWTDLQRCGRGRRRTVVTPTPLTGRSASTRRLWYRHVLSPATSRQQSCRLQRRTEPCLRLRPFHQCHRDIRL